MYRTITICVPEPCELVALCFPPPRCHKLFERFGASPLTGETIPVPKGPGDFVRAGTLSTGDGGAVRVRATATGAGSVLASITALVEDAQVCWVLSRFTLSPLFRVNGEALDFGDLVVV